MTHHHEHCMSENSYCNAMNEVRLLIRKMSKTALFGQWTMLADLDREIVNLMENKEASDAKDN